MVGGMGRRGDKAGKRARFTAAERRAGFYGIITANGLPSGSVTITGLDDKKAGSRKGHPDQLRVKHA